MTCSFIASSPNISQALSDKSPIALHPPVASGQLATHIFINCMINEEESFGSNAALISKHCHKQSPKCDRHTSFMMAVKVVAIAKPLLPLQQFGCKL